MRFKDVLAAYNWESKTWRGEATVFIPSSTGTAAVSGGLTITDGAFKAAFAKADGLNIALSRELYLQRIEAAIRVDPLFLGGGIGITTGPSIMLGGQRVEGIGLDGRMSYDWKDPGIFNMEGELRLATLRVIGGKLKYTSAQPGQSFGQVDVEADITFPPPDSRITEASASAKIAGSVYGTTGFNLSGTGQMNIPIVGERTGRMLLSHIGLVGCIDHGWGAAGFSYTWKNRGLDLFARSCSFAGFEAKPVARAAGAGSRVTVPDGMPAALFALTGDAGPPKVDLRGPGGRVVSTPTTWPRARRATVGSCRTRRPGPPICSSAAPRAARGPRRRGRARTSRRCGSPAGCRSRRSARGSAAAGRGAS